MKRIVFSLIIFLISLLAIGQSWSYDQGSNAFDGQYKTCFIQGTGYKSPYTKPLFVMNVFRGEINDPNIYLAKVPYGGCANNRVLIKFDNTEAVYEPTVTASDDKEKWFLHFGVDETVKDSLMKNIDEYIVPVNQTIKLRKTANSNSAYSAFVPQNDTIGLVEIDPLSRYWKCSYKKGFAYVHEMYIDSAYIQRSAKTIYLYFDKKIKSQKELKEFVQEIKSHSIMHLRLSSDCLQSDFEFSLKGSTEALNFVFKK